MLRNNNIKAKLSLKDCYWNQLGNRVGEGERRDNPSPTLKDTHYPNQEGGIRNKLCKNDFALVF
jgi:hypothetical protein